MQTEFNNTFKKTHNDQADFIPRMQGRFTIYKIVYNIAINRIKDKNHITS